LRYLKWLGIRDKIPYKTFSEILARCLNTHGWLTLSWQGCVVNVIFCVFCVHRELVRLCCVCCMWKHWYTWLYVLPDDCHKPVSVRCTLHVIKSQCMQELVYNCALSQTSVALQVELLALWVIENIWFNLAMQEGHCVSTVILIVFYIGDEAKKTVRELVKSIKRVSPSCHLSIRAISDCEGWRLESWAVS
jgi:hypothetical protein